MAEAKRIRNNIKKEIMKKSSEGWGVRHMVVYVNRDLWYLLELKVISGGKNGMVEIKRKDFNDDNKIKYKWDLEMRGERDFSFNWLDYKNVWKTQDI